MKDMVFFRPTTQQVLLDKYRSDFLYYGGVNPYNSVDKTKFFVVLNGSGILQSWPIMLLGIFFLFK